MAYEPQTKYPCKIWIIHDGIDHQGIITDTNSMMRYGPLVFFVGPIIIIY